MRIFRLFAVLLAACAASFASASAAVFTFANEDLAAGAFTVDYTFDATGEDTGVGQVNVTLETGLNDLVGQTGGIIDMVLMITDLTTNDVLFTLVVTDFAGKDVQTGATFVLPSLTGRGLLGLTVTGNAFFQGTQPSYTVTIVTSAAVVKDDATQTPLPGGLVFVLTGLAGLTVARRRRG